MDLIRAARYALPRPRRAPGYAKIWLLSIVPVFGVLWAMGYANLALRRLLKGHPDASLPDARADWKLLLRGLTVALLSLAVQLVVAFLFAPLFAAEGPTETGSVYAPALIQAAASPTALLVTAIAAVLTAVVLVRYALTDSMLAALNPLELWAHLRAEPAIWIATAAVGFLAVNLPEGIAWLLPVPVNWDYPATLLASSLLWTFGTMLQTHLFAQAFAWSRRTTSERSAHMGYRW